MTDAAEARSGPAWDPAVRRRIQRALDQLLATSRDVLTRTSDRDGFYAAPDPVGEFGDVTGLIATGNNQVIQRLQAQLDETREVIRQVYGEIDAYNREHYGDGWKPLPRDL